MNEQKKQPKIKLPKMLIFEKAWHDDQDKLHEKILADIAAEAMTENRIGYRMPDGSIYLGLHDGKDWFVTAEDATNRNKRKWRMDFNKAAEYASKLQVHGHNDWILPPSSTDSSERDILAAMFNAKSTGAFKGTYHDSEVASWYWSSTMGRPFPPDMRQKRFWDGCPAWGQKDEPHEIALVRCVRAVPRA